MLKKHQHFIPSIVSAKPELKREAFTKRDKHRLLVLSLASSKRSFLTLRNLKRSARPDSKVHLLPATKNRKCFVELSRHDVFNKFLVQYLALVVLEPNQKLINFLSCQLVA